MICRNCNVEFSTSLVVAGKRRNMCNRKFCLKCSPFGSHNNRAMLSNGVTKKCPACQTELEYKFFYKNKGRTTGFCKKCHNNSVVKRQQNYKKTCVAYKGGACEMCGYSKYYGALEFHHKDPTKKDFTIAKSRHSSFNETTKKELDKCLMLCANCHREEHAKIKNLI